MFLAQLKLFSMDGDQMKRTVISLFAGCGGSSLGYKWAGCNVRLALEFQKYAAEVYRLNHPHTPVMEKDIRDVTGREILDCAGLEEVAIVDGSPPCSGFSVSGNVEKDWGKVKVYSAGIKQRVDDLFFEYARLIEELEPMVFVAENVKGLTIGASAGVLGSHQISMFQEGAPRTIIDVLTDLNYTVRYKVLNAMYYGVPQARERLFIIGYRKDLCTTPTFPIRERSLISTKESIGDLINDGTDQREGGLRPELMKKFFRPGCSRKDVKRICKENNLKVYSHNYRRDRWDKPFYTIGKWGRPYHPKVDRPLSIAEAKRLQTFPDDFILPHSSSQNWERMGRAVPPLLMKAIAINILSDLERSNHGND